MQKDVRAIFANLENQQYLCSCKQTRDVAQLASAPALGAGGPAFESRYPDRRSDDRLFV